MSSTAYNRNSPGAMSVPPFPSVKKVKIQNSRQTKTTRKGGCVSVLIGDPLECVFSEFVSVEFGVESDYLVNGPVKRRT